MSSTRLINISTRGLVETGNNVLIAGCSLAGASGSNDVVVRALGPSLVPLGVNNALPDPVITLYDSNANVITANDNWKDTQRTAIKHWPPAAERSRRSHLSQVSGRRLYRDCHRQKWKERRGVGRGLCDAVMRLRSCHSLEVDVPPVGNTSYACSLHFRPIQLG